jgi:hypothetical protein
LMIDIVAVFCSGQNSGGTDLQFPYLDRSILQKS